MAIQHEDFGEKIGGAKKDLWRRRGLRIEDLGDMNEREAEKYVRKDSIWKKPDYPAMVDGGTPIGVVYFIKKVRDSLAPAPIYRYSDRTPEDRHERRIQYIETVRELQSVLESTHTVADAMSAYRRFLIDLGYVEETQGWATGRHYAATLKGQDNPAITSKLAEALRVHSELWFERAFTEGAKKAQFCVPKEEKIPAGYEVHYNDGKHVFSAGNDWLPGTYYVTKGYSILQKNLESREAAVKWAQNRAAKRSKDGKSRFVPPQLEKIRRTGPDFRDRDIMGQDYLDTFGFRGGEFGNWMHALDRQASLNMGFEALKDLAAVLGIGDRDIAFGGELAIAFGARGSGNAAAHYEPMRRVINLTKMNGAGSLAHEWWHALDDYLGKKSGARGYLSENPHLSPLFAKLIDTIKWKPETKEQAEKRTEQQNKRLCKEAEYAVDSAMGYDVRQFGNDDVKERYAALKTAFLSGEPGSVQKLSDLKKEIRGHIIPKSERTQLESYEGILFAMRQPKEPVAGRTKTDFCRDSALFGKSYEKDGGYWDSNVEMTARAFACYVMDKLPYTSDYLCGHAESAVMQITDRDGQAKTVRAFPVGEERKAINAVFDEIVADLKLQKVFSQEDIGHSEKTSVLERLSQAKAAEKAVSVQIAKKQTEPVR